MRIKSVFAGLVIALVLNSQFLVLSRAADPDEAYKSAHECYVDLKADANAQKLREPWEKCIKQFEQIAKKYRRHGKGADAQYSLGKLYEELANNSKNQADWLRSVKEYESFARQFSGSSMADDAYFRAACIHWEYFHDKSKAKSSLSKIIKFYKEGDKAGEAKKYLEAVEAGVVPREETMVIQGGKGEFPVVIVIDPGHGGSDTGALGSDKTPEKDLTLVLSKKLAGEMKKRIKNVRVFLTRDDDKTLTLDDRVKFANSKKADFFISIHANASTSKKQHGVQTYYLNNASDEASERLAAQENKYAGRKTSDLEKIIATMIQNASTDESRGLANAIHNSLIQGLSSRYSGVADQKVRSALFYVLVGVKCPSVLIETSYVSNPQEEKRLKDSKYQASIANAIVTGLQQHLKSKKTLASNL